MTPERRRDAAPSARWHPFGTKADSAHGRERTESPMHRASTQNQSAVSTPLATPTASPLRGLSAPSLVQPLDRMSPATLAQLDAVALLNRIDTKFLHTASQLTSILPSLVQDYRVLEIQGRRLHQYR